MNIILIGFWICERSSGRTKLKLRPWLRALDANVRRMQAEAPAGWEASQPPENRRTSDVVAHRASSLSFSR